jgi:hypothetical protein
MWNTSFWTQTAERAVKTASQAAITAFALTDPGAVGFDALAADWSAVASFALGGAVLSVLTSLASRNFSGDGDSPSLVSVGSSSPEVF